ncbi:O-antigen ligase family protein [Microbacterium oryzae]|uniref:O-antigen ligase domain-containing protein n=1 Tax=Microbacterium oryzae TaxID=743009 RepID=A0A6I6E1R7_9MICO|nr:O-antigen ligase family protein [Microbacterium oryzae]QGU27829.1 O-antigen ligase domain-containing protein [Microbacterium oryzae]
MDAVTMLTIYLVLLFAFPSNLALSALGGLGRPSFLWGLVLMLWWTMSRLQARGIAVRPTSQPVRLAFGALVVVLLLGFAAALLRGQPEDQISTAFMAVARLVSWAGVFLVAIDGISTMRDLTKLTRRIVVGGALLALLGLAQFATDQPLIGFLDGLPGFTGSATGLADRGGFTRSSATATHPLEYATVLAACVPLAVAAAIARAPERAKSGRARWWFALALLALGCFLAVSRSALIGFAVAVMATIPALPSRYRAVVIFGTGFLAAAAVVAIPGLFGTLSGMFAGGASNDSSTQSRVAALELLPFFLSGSPVLGAGFGTFLPRYYIFDNQWALSTAETGIAGVAALALFILAAVASAFAVRRQSPHQDAQLYGRVLAAAMLAVAVVLAFFDGLSFPMAGGMLFLLAGLCGSIRSIGHADSEFMRGMAPGRTARTHMLGMRLTPDAPVSAIRRATGLTQG